MYIEGPKGKIVCHNDDKCQGAGYLNKGGEWERCDCFKVWLIKNSMREAGVQDSLWVHLRWSDIGKNKIVRVIKQGYSEGIMNLVAGKTVIRWGLAALYLRDICSQGKSIQFSKLNGLIDSHFSDPDRCDLERAKSCNVLWLSMDFMRKHAWSKHILDEVLSTRLSKRTIITSPHALDLGFNCIRCDLNGK